MILSAFAAIALTFSASADTPLSGDDLNNHLEKYFVRIENMDTFSEGMTTRQVYRSVRSDIVADELLPDNHKEAMIEYLNEFWLEFQGKESRAWKRLQKHLGKK